MAIDYDAVWRQAREKYGGASKGTTGKTLGQKATAATGGYPSAAAVQPSNTGPINYDSVWKQAAEKYGAVKQPTVSGPKGTDMASLVSLPSPRREDEKEELRSEVRQLTQLAKGVSPETLATQAELREQKLQNISAEELKKRHEQAAGHLKEAKQSLADLGGETYITGLYSKPRTEEEDTALRRERDKWQGIVDDLATRYYYRENLEKKAALAGDTAAQTGFQSIEDIREDMKRLGAISAGDDGSEQGQADLARMMEKYGMSERELKQKAPELITQLQGQWDQQESALADAGYDYGRMEEFDRRLEDRQRAVKREESLTKFSQEHPVLASAATVGLAPFQGIEYGGAVLSGLGKSDTGDIGSYTPLNTYNMNLTRGVNTMRGTVAREVEEKWGPVGSFAYGVGMSMADFLAQAGATGAGNLTLGIMGSSAAANTTMECVDRRLTNRQALTLGAIAGVAEIVTEKVSLDALLDRSALNRSAIGYLMKNVLAEGSEEVASDLINWTADIIVSKDRSQWKQAIREYENRGYSEGEAFGLALKDQAIDMGLSFLSGAISGGVMAGGSVAVNGLQGQTSADWESSSKLAEILADPINWEGQKSPAVESGEGRYSIEQLPDGKKYVKADRRVIFGNDPDSWGEQLEAYINGKIRKGENVQLTAEDGAELILSAVSAGKISSPHTSWGTTLDDESYYKKVNAGAHIDELIQVSKDQGKTKLDKDGRHGEFAAGGWRYRTAYFRDFDGKYCQVDISVAKGADGNVIYNIGSIKERSFPTIAGSSAKGGALKSEKTSSENIIPQEAGKGNEKEIKEKGIYPLLTDAVAENMLGDHRMMSFLARKGDLELKSNMTRDEKHQAVKEAVTRIAQRGNPQTALMAGKESGFVQDGEIKMTPEEVSRLDAVCKALGVRAQFVDQIDGGIANGKIQGSEILLARDMQDPVAFVIAHEWTHRIQDLAPEEYGRFREALGEDLYSRAEELKNRYEERGFALTQDQLLDEAAADMAGELLRDGQLLDQFLEKHRADKSMLEKLLDAIRDIIGKLTGAEKAQAQTVEGKLTAALEAATKQAQGLETVENENTAPEGGEAVSRYSINKEFSHDLQEWYEEGQAKGQHFILGSTGATLQGLGAIESDIYMTGDKIKTILKDHPEITIDEISHIPEILDDPVLILKSKGTGKQGRNSRMVLYGSLQAKNGQPVLTVLDLRPSEHGFLLDDMQKVNSAYTKQNPVDFVIGSDVLFVDKKRTVPLLRKFGLTIASRQLLQNGSIGSISYDGDIVNMEGVPFFDVVGLQ